MMLVIENTPFIRLSFNEANTEARWSGKSGLNATLAKFSFDETVNGRLPLEYWNRRGFITIFVQAGREQAVIDALEQVGL